MSDFDQKMREELELIKSELRKKSHHNQELLHKNERLKEEITQLGREKFTVSKIVKVGGDHQIAEQIKEVYSTPNGVVIEIF